MLMKKVMSLCAIVLLNLAQNLMADGWQPPQSIGMTNAPAPAMACDADGNCMAVWSYSDGVHACIQAAKKPFGGEWSTPVSISSNDQQANSPKLVIDKHGNATAVWKLTYGTEWNDPSLIQAATLAKGSDDWIHIGGPLPFLNVVYNSPKLAVDGEGNVMTLWLSDEGVQGARLFPGWSTWFALSAFGKDEVDLDAPDFALDSSGNAVMVFESRHENGWIVIKSTTLAHNCLGPWSDPVQLSRADHWSSTPTIKADAQGNAVAVWLYQNPGVYIEAATYREQKWTPTPLPKNESTYSSLAVTPAGKAYLLWYDFQSSDFAVMCSTLDRESTDWSKTVQLSPVGEKMDCCGSLAVDSSGNAVAFWPNKSLGLLQAVSLPNQSKTWSKPVNVGPYDLKQYDELYPRIALASNDSGVIIYSLSNQVQVVSETKLFGATN